MDYPLHHMVWKNDCAGIEKFLRSYRDVKETLEKVDPRGRTPLLLAIVLKRMDCVKVLLQQGANCLANDKQYWSAMDEATASGDPDLLHIVLQYRQFQLLQIATDTVPKVLAKLQTSPDFYVEMAWSFSSWIPFVSHLLPSDTYKIWKSANAVRVDTTLLGFENRKWKRGRLSLVFRLAANCAEVIEIDHNTRQYSLSKVEIHKAPRSPKSIVVPPEEISWRLTNPVVSSYIDVDAISFERAKTGTGFFGSLVSFGNSVDKVENIGGYDCSVYTASDVKLVSQKRTEHLLKEDKKKRPSSSEGPSSNDGASGESRLASLLSAAVKRSVEVEELSDDQHTDVTEEQYFDEHFDLGKRFIGRPKEMTTKMQRFHATLWMSDKFPLSLQDQILPIIDLLAQRHSHVKKLREFITVHLPAGFPVKIDLPLYYVLTATVQQMNVHGTVTPVEGVHTFSESVTEIGPDKERQSRPAYEITFCAVDESVFEIPPHYRKVDDITKDSGNDFLSSTLEATIESHQQGSNSVFGDRLVSALASDGAPSHSSPPPTTPPETSADFAFDEEEQMQMALAMSLEQTNNATTGNQHSQQAVSAISVAANRGLVGEDRVLQAALTASLRDFGSSDAARLAAQEEADLAAAIALSLKEQ